MWIEFAKFGGNVYMDIEFANATEMQFRFLQPFCWMMERRLKLEYMNVSMNNDKWINN